MISTVKTKKHIAMPRVALVRMQFFTGARELHVSVSGVPPFVRLRFVVSGNDGDIV